MAPAAIPIHRRAAEACPLCGNRAASPLLRARDRVSRTGTYVVARCASCSVAFTDPRPQARDLPRLYHHRPAPARGVLSRLVARARSHRRRRSIRKLVDDTGLRSFTALEFGCGDGGYALDLADHPSCHHVVAADFPARAPTALAATDRVTYRSYAQLRTDADVFDVVFARHVLEHQLDPNEFVRRIRPRIREGGYLVVVVPNFEPPWRKLFGRHYAAIQVPRHLLHFDAATLGLCLAPFELVSMTDRHTPALGTSLRNLLRLPASLAALAGAALFPVQLAVEAVWGEGTSLLAVCRRS